MSEKISLDSSALNYSKNGFKAHIYKCGIMLRISLKAQ